uniref:NOA1/YqeH-like C-terminal domain-containing protein n=1 Tax=Leersia perrieri TaxID=77586 RepID=A0A0D9XCZ4_9ORYZ
MQSADPSLPGFFSVPSPKSPDYRARLAPVTADDTRISASLKTGHLRNDDPPSPPPELEKVVVCARCHSLRHYGVVKRPEAEPLLPDFDFVAAVGPRLASPTGARSLVLLLADASDFDGSFPRAVARLVAAAGESHCSNWKHGAPGNTTRALLVAKLFDTPGLLHGHQLTSRLNREEQKLVRVSKEMRPRTYRIKTGQSVHIGGLVRLDIEELTVGSIYVTVWASPLVPLHMGKTENAATMADDHFGLQLQPPIGQERVNELGTWVRKQFKVSGNSWDVNTKDIAIAGLGWFGIGISREFYGVSIGVNPIIAGCWEPGKIHVFQSQKLLQIWRLLRLYLTISEVLSSCFRR